MFNWFGRKKDPFDPAWKTTLQRGVWQYRYLDATQRQRVQEVVAHLVARKTWSGGGRFVVTGEMRVVVSGVSALVTLGLDEPFFFPRLRSFILYPSGYTSPDPGKSGAILETGDPVFGGGPRLGEAWHGGPVVLSWRGVQRDSRARGRGHNLVLHEMAHHLDGYDGDMDGVPHFDDRDDLRRWYDVTDEEYHRLVGQARRREVSLLDHYGATNRAEFFAVATECFFERPHAMRSRHGSLYGLLRKFYRQDPAEWLPAAGDADAPRERRQQACKQRPKRPRFPDLSHLGLGGVDELFSHAVLLMEDDDYENAEKLLTEVLARAPDDAEAQGLRGEARLELNNIEGAIADCRAALAADPHDVTALLTLATASLAKDDDATARTIIARLLRDERESPDVRFLEGQLYARAGKFRQAVRTLRRAIFLNPHDADAHLWLADCLEEQGDSSAAGHHRRRALHLDPSLESETG